MFKSCRYTLTTLSFELQIYMPSFSFSEEMNIYKNNKFKNINFVFAEKTFDTIFPANKLAHFTEQFLNFSPVFHTYLRFHCRYHQYNQLQPLNFVNLNVQITQNIHQIQTSSYSLSKIVYVIFTV